MSETGVIRTNISIPRTLKARMDAIKESVNWSGVAAEAFEAKLLELQSKKETNTMEDVIARMKAADEIDSKEERQNGRALGEDWAKEDARPKELRRLAAWHEECDMDEQFAVCMNGLNRGIGAALYDVIEGDPDDSSNNFWECVLGAGSLIENKDFAAGFVEGALKVWSIVEPKL